MFVAATVALAGAQQLGTDGPWWLELSRYLSYPLLLVPAFAALFLSWRLGRFWVVASVVAIIVFATVAMGFVWHPGRREGNLRLMTYNVKAGNAWLRPGGVEALAREVARYGPDVVVMQDAHPLLRGRPSEAEKAPLFGLPEIHVAGQYIIASRLPLRDCSEGVLETGGEPLAFARCTLDSKGGAVEVMTVHFESPRSGLNAARHEGFDGIVQWQQNHESRLAQARALARALEHGKRPLILAGDLNAPESSAVIQSLLAVGLRDAFSSAGRGYGYSYGHTLRPAFSFLRIDHILVSPQIGVSDCFVGEKEASDHRPVIADLVLHESAMNSATTAP